MKFLTFFSSLVFVMASLVQTNVVQENSISSAVDILEGNSKDFEHHQENEPPIQVLACPDPALILPCTCKTESDRVYVDCYGSKVNQTTVENAFREIRRANEIEVLGNRGIHIFRFRLEQTGLTQLDLAPFYGSRIDYFWILDNFSMTKLVTSGGQQGRGSIHVNVLYLWSSPLNSEGFGDTLKYFSNEMTSFDAQDVPLGNYNSNNSHSDSELLLGLSAHTNLKDLLLYYCNISGRLTSDRWNFKGLKAILSISLVGSEVTEVGENVFDFDVDGGVLYIRLNQNKLNESSFHQNSGISRPGRQTSLYLESNPITTLPAATFETFLDAHPQNDLDLFNTRLICDQRLSWLKSRREEFRNRVYWADCINDPGYTVFDSDLIP